MDEKLLIDKLKIPNIRKKYIEENIDPLVIYQNHKTINLKKI